MVRDLERVQKSSKFPESAPAGEAVFYRTYSRRQSTGRESWQQVGDRILEGLVSLGKLTPSQAALTAKMQQQLKSLSSGRGTGLLTGDARKPPLRQYFIG
jgi:ribonucleotide reductase class II